MARASERKRPASTFDVVAERGSDPAFCHQSAQSHRSLGSTSNSGAIALTARGQVAFNPPKKFKGKEDLKKFAFKLKSYMAVMHRDFRNIIVEIEFNPDREMSEGYLVKQDGAVNEAPQEKVGLFSGS